MVLARGFQPEGTWDFNTKCKVALSTDNWLFLETVKYWALEKCTDLNKEAGLGRGSVETQASANSERVTVAHTYAGFLDGCSQCQLR